jgi:hypothetical protein
VPPAEHKTNLVARIEGEPVSVARIGAASEERQNFRPAS